MARLLNAGQKQNCFAYIKKLITTEGRVIHGGYDCARKRLIKQYPSLRTVSPEQLRKLFAFHKAKFNKSRNVKNESMHLMFRHLCNSKRSQDCLQAQGQIVDEESREKKLQKTKTIMGIQKDNTELHNQLQKASIELETTRELLALLKKRIDFLEQQLAARNSPKKLVKRQKPDHDCIQFFFFFCQFVSQIFCFRLFIFLSCFSNNAFLFYCRFVYKYFVFNCLFFCRVFHIMLLNIFFSNCFSIVYFFKDGLQYMVLLLQQ